ncbi:hypothetical protein ACFUIW_17515 [Streptomyces sp. NPDC057245]|uniref:hypothetical protein n=1 Tax=Streptomyces sp. NPDC057245 TaxID=3346065 RepID=UPI00363E5985
MNDLETSVRELRATAAAGMNAVELALLSREKLGPAFGAVSFVAVFRQAFGIPLPVLQRAQAWERFGWGDTHISDEEFCALLSPWMARSRPPGG